MHLKECEWRWKQRGEKLIRSLLKSCRLHPLNIMLRQAGILKNYHEILNHYPQF
jgi:hypothetical protein